MKFKLSVFTWILNVRSEARYTGLKQLRDNKKVTTKSTYTFNADIFHHEFQLFASLSKDVSLLDHTFCSVQIISYNT